jgi:hypothetical protein
LKKRKPPKLVVDNKLPVEPSEEFTYEEFKVIAEQLIDVHKRYPEIDARTNRARKNNDKAMLIATLQLVADYDYWRNAVAEHERGKLRVVKRKRD